MIDLDACPCSGKNLARLLRPAILTLLVGEELHGYEIVQRLTEQALVEGYTPDTAGVYRMLRSMEEMGVVESEWVLSDAGPAKRRYRITDAGLECTRRWMLTLQQYHAAVGHLLELGQKALHTREKGKKHGRRKKGKGAG